MPPANVVGGDNESASPRSLPKHVFAMPHESHGESQTNAKQGRQIRVRREERDQEYPPIVAGRVGLRSCDARSIHQAFPVSRAAGLPASHRAWSLCPTSRRKTFSL